MDSRLGGLAEQLDDLILSCYLSRDFHEGVRASLGRDLVEAARTARNET
jgi:hypothetical protein